jgi:hypothetical protein
VEQDAPLFGDDIDVYIMEGACNPGLCFAKGEDNGDDTVNFQVTAGVTYYVAVERDRVGFPPLGNFTVTVTCP